MGKIESKNTTIFNPIKNEIQCPLCEKIFPKNTLFIELNFHLYYCGKEKKKEKEETSQYKTNRCKNICIKKDSHEITHYESKSEEKRAKNNTKDESFIYKDSINDLQLVIDYNEEEDIYEEQLKNKRKISDPRQKYIELRDFLTEKREQMNFLMTVEVNSLSQMFKVLKKINIYYNIKIIYIKKNNEIKNYNLYYVVNKFIKKMIKLNIFEVKNEENILAFSFKNKKIDFEIIGVILAILLIYPEIKIKYKFPLILFKMLINETTHLIDIKYIDKKLYDELDELTKREDISKLNLFYRYEGNELILGGSNIQINEVNVFDYVEKVVNYKINKYKKKINIIKNVLFQFIPKKLVFSFNAEQLEQIINKEI